jgi:hypothetical protein
MRKIMLVIVFLIASYNILPSVWHGITQIGKCYGWECETVMCPDGYAVRLPSGKYLPCEDFYQYTSTGSEEYLK